MRKLVLQMQTSVDGYVSAADSDLAWQVWDWTERWPWDKALKADFNALLDPIDCILLSRKMAEEGYIDHWAHASRRFPADQNYAFAKKIVDAQKVILTNKLASAHWDRTEIARGGLVPEVNALKRKRGRTIVCFGGVGFASALVREGLVDELQLFVNPIAVSDGRSIFSDARGGMRLRLLASTAYACGIVVNRYQPC